MKARVFGAGLPFVFSSIVLCSCFSQTPAPVALYGTAEGAGSAGVHTVTRGDNLWSISKRYDIVMQDIVISNSLRAPFILNSGQRLKLPAPRTHRVRAGDSLYTISRLYAVSSSEIGRLNNLSAPYVVQPGQVLKLPGVTPKTQPKIMKASAVRPVPKPPVERTVRATPVPSTKPSSRGEGLKKDVQISRPKIPSKTPKRASSKFLTPVNGQVISTYGPKKNGLHNDGINIKAPRGTPIKAADNGVVVYAGSELKGSGNLVLVRHENRWMTAYAHMDSIKVKRGDVIKRGQSIGTVGATGSVDTPQLHFEVRRGTEAINPKRYLES